MGLGEIPVRTTMYSYHKMNGNSNDASGNGRNGTDTSITYGLGNGKLREGALFNITTSRIKLYTKAFSGDYTFIFWVNFTQPVSTSAPQYGLMCLMSANTTTTTLNINDTQALVYSTVVRNVPFISNQWGCIAWRYSGGKMEVSFNGDTFLGITIANPMSVSNLKQLGNRAVTDINDLVAHYVGKMDEVIIEERAWSNSEMRKYYTQAKGRF